MKYKICASWEMYNTWIVEVDSLEEAMDKVNRNEKDLYSVAYVGNYVDDSFTIDEDVCEEIE